MAALNSVVHMAWYGDLLGYRHLGKSYEQNLAELRGEAQAKSSDFLLSQIDSLEGIEQHIVDSLLLPMEQVMLRYIDLPLRSVALVDADILGQELADQAGIEPEDWWLSWDLSLQDQHVTGLVIAIPKAWCQHIDAHPLWHQLRYVYVDGWARLAAIKQQSGMGQAACAVLDQDMQGLFLGYFDAHVWRGMRRINVSSAAAAQDTSLLQHAVEEIQLSLLAMGFAESLASSGLAWQGSVLSQSLSRNETTLSHYQGTSDALNLRHGAWTSGPGWKRLKPWRRSALITLLAALVWSGMTTLDLMSLRQQSDQYEQQIAEAFHAALPDQPMVDALVQLQRAAGSDTAGAGQLLTQLYAISQVFRQQPWKSEDVTFRNGEMLITGSVKDLTAVNVLRQALQQQTQKDVLVVDTDLIDQAVRFRMKW